jgi:hypothetical protein
MLSILFLILLSIGLKTVWLYEGYRMSETQCIDYLEQLTLYGGQPFCGQGPVYYLYGGLLSYLSKEHMNELGMVFIALIDVVVLVLMIRVIKHEESPNPDYFPILLWIPLILTSSLEDPNSVATLGMAFAFMGFYVSVYSQFKCKEVIAGILLSLALYTTFTVLPIILVTLIYTFVTPKNKTHHSEDIHHITFIAEKKKAIFTMLAIILGITLLLFIIFPNIFFYTLLMHQPSSDTVTAKLTELLSWPPSDFPVGVLTFFLMFISSVLMLYKKRNIFSSVLVVAIFTITFISIKNFVVGDENIFYNRHYIPVAPFFIISLAITTVKEKNMLQKTLFYMITIVVLLYSTDIHHYVLQKTERPSELIRLSWGYNFIQPQEGRVLIESTPKYAEHLIADYHIPISMEQVDALPQMYSLTPYDKTVDSLLSLGVVKNLTEFEKYYSYNNKFFGYYDAQKLQYYKQRLCDGDYSLIILLPSYRGDYTMQEVLKSSLTLTNQQRNALFLDTDLCPTPTPYYYITLVIPTFETYTLSGGAQYTLLLVRLDQGSNKREQFSNLTRIDDTPGYIPFNLAIFFSPQVAEYYKQNFDTICNDSETIANGAIGNYIKGYDKKFYRICISGKTDLKDKYRFGVHLPEAKDILTVIIIFIGSYLYLKHAKDT